MIARMLLAAWRASILVAILSLAYVVHLHTLTLEALIEQSVIRAQYEEVASKELMAQRRTLEDMETRTRTVSCQVDILVAASRTGWASAYRLLRNGTLESCEDI